jgi:lysophospholipase L1-like esterase
MKYFYLYIFIIVCILFAVSYYNTMTSSYREFFNAEKQTFILLGDSILKNDAYVSDGQSVDEMLKNKTHGKTLCLAADHSKIVDVYEQISKIPDTLNDNLTTVFLSIGGNDILTHYVDKENDTTDTSILGVMLSSYKKILQNIRTKLPKANIVVLDIYYPENMKYKQYHSIINEWNTTLYKCADEPQQRINGVLKISNILTQAEDFSFGIEPSAIGSKKLVETILSSY